jgi:DNA repair protein RadD
MQKTLRPYQQEALNTLRIKLKEKTHPLLVTASVGAGKSVIIADLLRLIEKCNWRALCITMNSTLIEQNAYTYKLQGGNCGIYCAGLNAKDTHQPIIFGSPHSIAKSLPNVNFNLIVVDECHNIDGNDSKTMYMRILNHYGHKAQEGNYSFRVVGLTGTPYRGKSVSIVGENQFFKEEVCNISTSWLIKNKYLTPIQFGLCKEKYDFKHLRINQLGKFEHKELQSVIDKSERLTGKLMRELVIFMQNHTGAFIFAATRKHCEECAKSLPEGKLAIVTSETSHQERKLIMKKARAGIIKYLINVNCLTTGIDLPSFDVCVWLRPTESLGLYTQGIGRVLRLHEGKTHAIVLDYAGNLERHGDIDDPIINEALQPTEATRSDYCIPCYCCGCLNTIDARRCIGVVDNKRCDFYFQFKACPKCEADNDITARICRGCDCELIDPNAKLKAENITYTVDIKGAKYWVNTLGPSINAIYITNEAKEISESFFLNSEKARNLAYAKFVRNHIPKPSHYYLSLHDANKMHTMLHTEEIKTPHQLLIKIENNNPVILKKYFQNA